MNNQIIAQTNNATSTWPTVRTATTAIPYANLSRQATGYGIRSAVKLERRVLTEFCPLDASLGEDTAGVILAVLAYDRTLDSGDGDNRLTVCLQRRSDGHWVELDLMVLPRWQSSGKHVYLRLADVRELAAGNLK